MAGLNYWAGSVLNYGSSCTAIQSATLDFFFSGQLGTTTEFMRDVNSNGLSWGVNALLAGILGIQSGAPSSYPPDYAISVPYPVANTDYYLSEYVTLPQNADLSSMYSLAIQLLGTQAFQARAAQICNQN